MTVVVGFELGGWDAAEFVEEAVVVEPVDPFEGGPFEVFEAAPGSAVADEFGLVEPIDRLGQSVVVGVAAGPNGVHDAVFGEAFGVSNRQILNAAIRMVNQLVEIGAVALS